MTLRGIHLIFVGAVVLLSLFFGVWAFSEYQETGRSGYLLTMLGSIMVALGTVVYGVKFSQKVKTAVVFFFFLSAAPAVTHACTVCFKGDPDDPMNKGLRAGILVLLGVLVIIAFLFGRFFLNLRRRIQLQGEER